MTTVTLNTTIQISEIIKEEAHDSLLGALISHKVITQEQAIAFLSEDSEEEIEVEAVYEGDVVPFSPSTWEEPAEGGYCEHGAFYVETNCAFRRKLAQKYQRISRRIDTTKYEIGEMKDKAKRLKNKLLSVAGSLTEIDLMDYVTNKVLEDLSEEAYSNHSED